jgi:hypothetical protein
MTSAISLTDADRRFIEKKIPHYKKFPKNDPIWFQLALLVSLEENELRLTNKQDLATFKVVFAYFNASRLAKTSLDIAHIAHLRLYLRIMPDQDDQGTFRSLPDARAWALEHRDSRKFSSPELDLAQALASHFADPLPFIEQLHRNQIWYLGGRILHAMVCLPLTLRSSKERIMTILWDGDNINFPPHLEDLLKNDYFDIHVHLLPQNATSKVGFPIFKVFVQICTFKTVSNIFSLSQICTLMLCRCGKYPRARCPI